MGQQRLLRLPPQPSGGVRRVGEKLLSAFDKNHSRTLGATIKQRLRESQSTNDGATAEDN
jgi:hypothetical protein